MNVWQRFTLQTIKRVDHPAADLAMLPLLRAQLGQKPTDIPELARNPAWQGRWVAAQKAGEVLSSEQAWPLLRRLAEDSNRNVREGAAHGLASLISRYPKLLTEYEAALRSPDASDNFT